MSSYAATQPLEFVAEVFVALLDGQTLAGDILALYRRYGCVEP